VDDFARLSDEHARKVGFIGSANIEDIFELELNPKPDHYATRAATIFPQEFQQLHPRYYPAFRPLSSGRNAYTANFAPVAAAEFGMKSFGRSAETKVLNRWIPDEIYRRGLPGVSDCNLNERLNVVQSDHTLCYIAECDRSCINLDVGPDLSLPNTPSLYNLTLAGETGFNPERDCRSGQDEGECRDPEGEKGRWVFRRSLPDGFAWFVLTVGGGIGTLIGVAISLLAIWLVNRGDKAAAERKAQDRRE
jgi:hypothetical protein